MADRPSDEISPQAQLPDPRQWRDVPIDERPNPKPASRQQLALLLADDLEIGEAHQIAEVGGGKPCL